MANVLLLRSPSDEDAYESSFRALGYHTSSVSVLETVLTNVDALERVVAAGPEHERFDGVIVTSARACEAWKNAISRLMKASEAQSDSSWSKTPFYVVGKATASTLASIQESYPLSDLCPRDIRGEGEGTAEKLARFILDDLPSTSSPRRLLYLTGDKNRDTLPSILGAGGVQLESLQVYGTQGASSFAEDLEGVVRSLGQGKNGEDTWVVFFAPSSAEFVLPSLRKHFAILPGGDSEASLRRARVASIGPTTTSYLEEHLDLHVDLTANKPTAQDLSQGIAEWDKAARG